MATHKITLEVSRTPKAMGKDVAGRMEYRLQYKAVATFGPGREEAMASNPVTAGARAVKKLLAHMYRR